MVHSGEHGEISVTVDGSRLTVSGETYEIADVSSARAVRVPAAASGPILMTVVGAICLLSATGKAGWSGVLIGAALIAAAAVWWTQKKPTFELLLATRSEPSVAMASRDEAEIDRAAAAVNEALATRDRP